MFRHSKKQVSNNLLYSYTIVYVYYIPDYTILVELKLARYQTDAADHHLTETIAVFSLVEALFEFFRGKG